MTKKKKKPTWTDVKNIISGFDNSELKNIIGDLYRFSAENKQFFHSRFALVDDSLESYKRVIEKSMYPNVFENEGVDFASAKKAITQYSKAVDDIIGESELLVFAVECGNNFTMDIGEIDSAFYDSILDLYERAVESVLKLPDERQEIFIERLQNIKDSAAFIGWGDGDGLGDLYCQGFCDD